MKRAWMLLFSLLLSAGSGSVWAQEVKSATLIIDKMYCVACVQTVKKALNKVPGVVKADVNLDKKTATVSYDATKAGVNDLLEATANAGFPALIAKSAP